MTKRKTSKKNKAAVQQRVAVTQTSATQPPETQSRSARDGIANNVPGENSSPDRRSNTRRRKRTAKEQEQQRRNLFIGIVVIVVLVGAGAILALSDNNNPLAAVSPVEQERLDLDPVLGNPEAQVTIIEYGAYGCPACRSWHEAGIVEQLLDEFDGQVNHIFRNFPVISPAYDRMTAEIAQCALDQSEERFWILHDVFYTRASPGMSRDNLIELAGRNGLDAEALRECIESGAHTQTVQYHLRRGRELGLPGTPSFFINDQRMFSPSPQAMRQMIVNELNR